ncbi:histone-lysine N-methyltransferase SUVR4-like isoform X3 [Mercurialis annua]|uniref:histone-lysine N-methyltransferase SUVR4-like isoform X3 n=1 Tax=Mercurialis annua TaxID=3986 RepID=UPI00216013DC|nr:histone-lysine N-methyltransferase SUVR4-like isoform X3 [Mercurialis annua]
METGKRNKGEQMMNERALNAFKAAEALGIHREEVKPILKNLLSVFDRNWELIEADNYRALIDAYFDSKENKATEGQKVSSLIRNDESRKPSKGSHVEEQQAQTKIKAKKVEGQSSMTSLEPGIREKQKGIVNSGKRKAPIDMISISEQPVAVYDSSHPQRKYVFSNRNSRDTTEKNTVQLPDIAGSASNDKKNLAVAKSSLQEEVQLLLKCDYAVTHPNFKIPDLSSVHKFLEAEYLKNDLITSRFSLRNLLNDFCKAYLQLGNFSDSANVANKQEENTKRIFRKINDISKGSEPVRISLVDEIGNEVLPEFNYMSANTIYQNAYLQFSLARISDEDCCASCSGNCISSPIPCACARETGGEFAYTKQGHLKEEFLTACHSMRRNARPDQFVFCQNCPLERSKNEYMPEKCKGHLVRKFIKECWRKCGCNMNCGNRVVQRGITSNLQVFMTGKGKGWGLRPLKDLPKGSFVCEYVGEILTNMELYDRNLLSNGGDRHTYPVTLDADWGSERILSDEHALCLDATFSGNVARFINHRCEDANVIDIPVEVETPDRHYYHFMQLAFFTTREVGALEELTWDYGIDFNDEDHPIKAFGCCCGSASCRDVAGKRMGKEQQANDKALKFPIEKSMSRMKGI